MAEPPGRQTSDQVQTQIVAGQLPSPTAEPPGYRTPDHGQLRNHLEIWKERYSVVNTAGLSLAAGVNDPQWGGRSPDKHAADLGTNKRSLFYRHPYTWNSPGISTLSGPAMEESHFPIPWAAVNNWPSFSNII